MMRRYNVIIFIIILTCFLSGSAFAEEIGWVTIRDQSQAEQISQIIKSAYTRVGNKFLVGFNSEQFQQLQQAEIENEILLSGADPSRTYLVQPACGNIHNKAMLNKLADRIDLGNNMSLMILSNKTLSSVTDSLHYFAIPLGRLKVRWLYNPPTIATGFSGITSLPEDSLAGRVNPDSVYAWDTRLEAFRTRYDGTDSLIAARDWIKQKFLDWGYTDVSLQAFTFNGLTLHNIVCIKPGTAKPDKVIVVGGHYDSINFQSDKKIFAPGADDNGSGTTTTMEIARALAGIPLRKTVIFMPFSAEEVGLVGSQFAAEQFVADSTDIEVMYNFDMVGFDPDSVGEISVSASGTNPGYADLTKATAERVTNLTPALSMSPGGSDHMSFAGQGYNVVNNIEANFNTQGWHTNLDISSRMNFTYLTEVIKMAIVSIAYIANAAEPTKVEKVIDQGDGQSLEVFWENCDPTYTYTVRWGLASGVYSDSIMAPAGACSYVIRGLMEDSLYYISVVSHTPEGYPAVYSVEGSERPLVNPRQPQSIVVDPDLNRILLDWDDNTEADIDGYNIYRQAEDTGQWLLRQAGVQVSSFDDNQVNGHILYHYRVVAVDRDGHESDSSDIVSAVAATFDWGILVIDEISQDPGVQPQEAQEAFFDSVFDETMYVLERVENDTSVLSRSIAGQYSSLFWFDDDLATKLIKNSTENIAWYAQYSGNIMVSGLETIKRWGTFSSETADILLNEFGLEDFTDNSAFDFAGAHGQYGWPSLEIDTNNIFGYLPRIPKLQPRPGAMVIYTYNSITDDPEFEGQPVGLLYKTDHGYRVLLGFPTMYLTESSARSLIQYIISQFGETGWVSSYGDVDNSGAVNVADLTTLIAVLFSGGPEPSVLNNADADGSCSINIADLTYLLDFMFSDGPEPVAGCVE